MWVFTIGAIGAIASQTSCVGEVPASDGDSVPSGAADAPDGTSGPFPVIWQMSSPVGMTQLPEEDVAVHGSIRFAIRGFDQIARASDGSRSLEIVPRRGGRGPLRILNETAGSRSLVWMLSPVGVLWHNPIVWDDGKADLDGRLLYHVLEGGVMTATWSRPPAGTALEVAFTDTPLLYGDVFASGALRVRVIAGTVARAGNVLTITASGSRLQIIIYEDVALDVAGVDAIGAVTAPIGNHVSELPAAVRGKHVRFTSAILGIDKLVGPPSTRVAETTIPHAVVNGDRAELLVGHAADDIGWRISSLAVKIIKTGGVIGMRRMRYAYATDVPGTSVGGQTFNFYVHSPRGTVTLWPVGRVTSPYRIAFARHPNHAAPVVLADFPSTDNDYSEDLPAGRDVMHTRTAWAWDDTTLVEAATLEARAPLTHTGREGNSIDGGWRHVITGSLQDFSVGDASGFRTVGAPTSSYDYIAGTAFHARVGSKSVFHRQRYWQGAWAERPDRIAVLRSSPNLYVGMMKELHAGDVLPAGRTLSINQVIRIDDSADEQPGDVRAAFSQYGIDTATPMRRGLLDVDAGGAPLAPWDLAIATTSDAGDRVGVVFRP